MSLTESTELAIGSELLDTIKNKRFCVIGCGGIGAFFAEMLVRTGAQNIVLIDGDIIECKDLNRTPFVTSDVGEFKVEALKNRLELINKSVEVSSFNRHMGPRHDKPRQEVRDSVCNSECVLISVDKNKERIICEKLVADFKIPYLVIGLKIEEGRSEYACGWMTRTGEGEKDSKGSENEFYMSIVMEAVSVGFTTMMERLKSNNKDVAIVRRFYENYRVRPGVDYQIYGR